jgi:outer membrane protein TolC
VVQRLLTAGTVTSLVVESALLAADDATEATEAARSRALQTEHALARWTDGHPADLASPCAPPPTGVLDDLVAQHPAVRAARAAATAAGDEAIVASRKQWFWPRFFEVTFVREFEDHTDGVLLQAGIPLPVPQPDASAAQAHQQRAQFERDAVEQRVRAAIEGALAQYQGAGTQLARLEAHDAAVAKTEALLARGEQEGAEWSQLWTLQERLAARQRRRTEAAYLVELRAITLRRVIGEP